MLYQNRAFAEVDGRLVDQLADTRGESLVAAFRVITVWASGANFHHRRGARAHHAWTKGVLAVMLPALMLLQLALQFTYSEIIPVYVMDELFPK